ncbi:MAG: glycosyltransferase [Rhodovibrionaceae bacterium]
MADIHILVPVYNDWAALRQLLVEINGVAGARAERIAVCLIDDGSATPHDLDAQTLSSLDKLAGLEIIELASNGGHARAIAIGLSAVTAEYQGKAVLVMDGDGEDKPEDIARLLDRFNERPDRVVVAQRRRRSEGAAFRLFYRIYKLLFRAMTGQAITFGNFCICPWPLARRLTHMPELWSHLAGSLLRARVAIDLLPTDRGARYAGRSQMRFTGLLQHGLGAIAVDLDRVLVRLLIALGSFIGLLALALLGIILVRLFSEVAIPGWATTAFGLVSVLLVQSVVFAVLLLFISLKTRNLSEAIPALRYGDYIAARHCLIGAPPKSDAGKS